MTLPIVERLQYHRQTLFADGPDLAAEATLCLDAADTIETLHKALDEIRTAAFSGYLTADHCAEVVMSALAEVEGEQTPISDAVLGHALFAMNEGYSCVSLHDPKPCKNGALQCGDGVYCEACGRDQTREFLARTSGTQLR